MPIGNPHKKDCRRPEELVDDDPEGIRVFQRIGKGEEGDQADADHHADNLQQQGGGNGLFGPHQAGDSPDKGGKGAVVGQHGSHCILGGGELAVLLLLFGLHHPYQLGRIVKEAGNPA